MGSAPALIARDQRSKLLPRSCGRGLPVAFGLLEQMPGHDHHSGLEARPRIGHPQSIRRSRGSLRLSPEPSPDPKPRGDLRHVANATSALLEELHTRYHWASKPGGSSQPVIGSAAEPRAVGWWEFGDDSRNARQRLGVRCQRRGHHLSPLPSAELGTLQK